MSLLGSGEQFKSRHAIQKKGNRGGKYVIECILLLVDENPGMERIGTMSGS